MLLEFSQLIAWEAVVARVIRREIGLGLRSEAEGSADPLHVDAEDARSFAAAERGDREPGQVS